MVVLKAKINGDAFQGPLTGVASQATKVFGDVLELAELQTQLVQADAAEAAKKALVPSGLLFLGGCAAVASLPVLTFGLASLIEEISSLNVWQSQILVGTVMALFASIMIYFAVSGLRKAGAQFQRSAKELVRNVAWAKSIVRSTSPTNTETRF
jgi:Putative Actinobacterial Holin-X, holin superfamily III